MRRVLLTDPPGDGGAEEEPQTGQVPVEKWCLDEGHLLLSHFQAARTLSQRHRLHSGSGREGSVCCQGGSEVNGLDSQKGEFWTNHHKASDWFSTMFCDALGKDRSSGQKPHGASRVKWDRCPWNGEDWSLVVLASPAFRSPQTRLPLDASTKH